MPSVAFLFFFFSSRRRHTRLQGDWSSDVCSSDLQARPPPQAPARVPRAACRRSSSLRSPASRRGAAIPRPPRGPRSRRGASREQPLQQGEQLLDRPDGVIAHVTDPDGRVLQRTVAGADGPPRVLEPADDPLGARSFGQPEARHGPAAPPLARRSEEHTSELQSPCNLVCRLLLEKKKNIKTAD